MIDRPTISGVILTPKSEIRKIGKNPVFLKPFLYTSLLSFFATYIIFINTSQVSELVELAKELGTSVDRLTHGVGLLASFYSLFILLFNLVSKTILAKVYLITIGKNVKVKKLFSLNIFIFFITILINSTNAIINFIMNKENVIYTNFSFIYNGDGLFGALIKTFDISIIWSTFLLILGLKILAPLSKKHAISLGTVLIILNFIYNVFLQ